MKNYKNYSFANPVIYNFLKGVDRIICKSYLHRYMIISGFIISLMNTPKKLLQKKHNIMTNLHEKRDKRARAFRKLKC